MTADDIYSENKYDGLVIWCLNCSFIVHRRFSF